MEVGGAPELTVRQADTFTDRDRRVQIGVRDRPERNGRWLVRVDGRHAGDLQRSGHRDPAEIHHAVPKPDLTAALKPRPARVNHTLHRPLVRQPGAPDRPGQVGVAADRRLAQVGVPADRRLAQVGEPGDRRPGQVDVPADRRPDQVDVPADRRPAQGAFPPIVAPPRLASPPIVARTRGVPADRRLAQVGVPADRRLARSASPPIVAPARLASPPIVAPNRSASPPIVAPVRSRCSSHMVSAKLTSPSKSTSWKEHPARKVAPLKLAYRRIGRFSASWGAAARMRVNRSGPITERAKRSPTGSRRVSCLRLRAWSQTGSSLKVVSATGRGGSTPVLRRSDGYTAAPPGRSATSGVSTDDRADPGRSSTLDAPQWRPVPPPAAGRSSAGPKTTPGTAPSTVPCE